MLIESSLAFSNGRASQLLREEGVDVFELLQAASLHFTPGCASEMKRHFKAALSDKGFAIDIVPDAPLGWRVQALSRSGIAIQFEFGNLANAMYDILKFGHLFNVGRVNQVLLVAPMQSAAKVLGGNIACFEKLEREYLLAFDALVATPLELIGIR